MKDREVFIGICKEDYLVDGREVGMALYELKKGESYRYVRHLSDIRIIDYKKDGSFALPMNGILFELYFCNKIEERKFKIDNLL